MQPFQKAPCVSSFIALQHISDSRALFFTPLWEKRPTTFALVPGSHTLGFGYPLGVSFNSQILRKPISASNTLELHSSEPFSSRMIRSESLPPFPLLRFSSKPFSLLSALQRFDPIQKAVPLYAPEGLVRVGDSCSLESFHLSDVSLRPASHRSISLPWLPLQP